jgi:hypothetical protein
MVRYYYHESLLIKGNSGSVVAEIAKSRAEIDASRLLVLAAALQVRLRHKQTIIPLICIYRSTEKRRKVP